jgi:hypothetical protein
MREHFVVATPLSRNAHAFRYKLRARHLISVSDENPPDFRVFGVFRG